MHFGTDCAELLVARVHCLSSGSAQESGFLPSTGEQKSHLAQRWCTGGCAAAGGSVRVPGATGGRWGSYNGPGRVSTGLICIEPPDQQPRNLDLSKSYPRHPGRNFTESRVRRRALSRRRTSRDGLYRTSRPKNTPALGKTVSVTNKRLCIQAQTCARARAVAGTRAVFHDAQIPASVLFRNTSSPLSRVQVACAFDLAPRGTPPSFVTLNVGPLGNTRKIHCSTKFMSPQKCRACVAELSTLANIWAS
jgi:hypothetical protein